MSPLAPPTLPRLAWLRFLVGLVAGFALWWWLAPPVLFPLYGALIEGALGLFHGGAISGVERNHAILTVHTNFLAPGSSRQLIDSTIEPRPFTLGLPLVWAAVVATVPAGRLPRALLLASLAALLAYGIVLVLLAAVAVPRLALRQGVTSILETTYLAGARPIPWSAPNAILLAAVDHLRIALVHFNLFVLPPVLGVWAWADARRRADKSAARMAAAARPAGGTKGRRGGRAHRKKH